MNYLHIYGVEFRGLPTQTYQLTKLVNYMGNPNPRFNNTLEQETARNEGKSRQRPGRPSIVSDIDNATMANFIQADSFFLLKRYS